MKFDITNTLKNKVAQGSQKSEPLILNEIELNDAELKAVWGGRHNACAERDEHRSRHGEHSYRRHHREGGYGYNNYNYYDQGNCDPYSGSGAGSNYTYYTTDSCQQSGANVVFIDTSSNCGY